MTYVFLHGFSGGPESWDAVATALPSDARVVRVQLAGHGAAPVSVEGWDAEVARIDALLERERVEDAHLVGYSLGGRVGLSLLAHSARFSRSTLIGAHPGLPDAAARAERRAADDRWIRVLRERGLRAFIDAWEALPMWATQEALDPERLASQRRLRESHTAEGLAHALEALGLAQMPATDPSALRVPIQLVVGERDEKHRALSGALAERLPRAALRVVEGAGHNVVLERPDALAALLLRPEPS